VFLENMLGPYRDMLVGFNVLAAIGVVYLLGVSIMLDSGRWRLRHSHLTGVLDTLLFTAACLLTGGIHSHIRFLYFVLPVGAALRTTGPATIVLTVLAAMAYTTVVPLTGGGPDAWREAAIFDFYLVFEGLMASLLGKVILRSSQRLEQAVADRTQELREANGRLQRADQLKRDFVNAVSHELRTPLTSIRGYAEFLEDEIGGDLSLTQRDFVGQIQVGARRLEDLVSDLLDFARLESGTLPLNRRPIVLGDKVREVTDSFRPQLQERGLKLSLVQPADPVLAFLDPLRVGQVLTNLIGNAVKFTPAGGTITVALEVTDEVASLSVADTGVGIAPEHLAHLFEKFYQVDPTLTRERGGAGLGLAIAKALVDAHGGRLDVESTPGEGSRFTVTLPLAGEAPSAEQRTPLEAQR
jgi:signal transduction histidine kinase